MAATILLTLQIGEGAEAVFYRYSPTWESVKFISPDGGVRQEPLRGAVTLNRVIEVLDLGVRTMAFAEGRG